MICDATSIELSSDAHFESFLRRVEAGGIPGAEFTHAAHIAMAGGLIQRIPCAERVDRVRATIQNLNASHGLVTTKERGYHESLTRLWVHVSEAFLAESGLTGLEAVRALVAAYGRRSDLHREYYSYEVVTSGARYQWWPPDLKPLPAAWRRDGFLISTNPNLQNPKTVQAFLHRSYWAKNIPLDIVQRSLRGAVAFGIYRETRQVGSARVITDLATFGQLMDVFIDEGFRGLGLSKWLMDCIDSHPSLQGFRRWGLNTRDAHTLYERSGYRRVDNPESFMQRIVPEPYSPSSTGE